jgi:hypothetical protein
MITDLATQAGKGQNEWFEEALTSIKEKYHEIHSVLFFNDQIKIESSNFNYTADFNLNNSMVIKTIQQNLSESPFNKEVLTAGSVVPQKIVYHSNFISGKPKHFKLLIHGKPFYIKGVAYNTAHDWRDGNMPLSRRQVERDMQRIKDMGANTVRRYDHGIYDRNITTIAGEYGLNVMYGFWFDTKVDYYKDSLKVQEYIQDVVDKVTEYKDRSSIIAWSLGNETWGLLKHNFTKPYLTKVREGYVRMIELLAERIHEIDPTRPVFSCMEHEEYQLPGELAALHDAAPSVYVVGINSYYKEQISRLNQVFYQFDSLRPYLVSEFGPRGYWDPQHNRMIGRSIIEDTDAEKAEWYKYQWNNYVKPFEGYNIGGVAYCWHDRMEGSNTWFGITDYKGRPKLSYYSLKEVWTGKNEETLPSYTIKMPDELKPGAEYCFTAVASKGYSKKINYRWSLNKDDYMREVDALSYTNDITEVRIKIPEKRSNYRLYLYVSDENGNVTTASVPIKVD